MPRWVFHPVSMLVYSILALVTSLFLYIYWYVEADAAIRALARTFNADANQFTSYRTWVVISIMSILLGIILMNMIVFFIYTVKNRRLVRTQKNFINSFTHELKTPVASLGLYLETFLAHELPKPDRDKYTSYMLKDVSRLNENINAILSMARIESKIYAKASRVEDARSLVRDFVRENENRFPNIKVFLHEDDDAPLPCRINKELFFMLMANLLSNSAKYSPETDPRVDIRLFKTDRKAHIEFSDNGMGFEPKFSKKIFKKFFQIGSPETMSSKGFGLGLFLVASIAKIHKGKIKAHSEGPGKGATFLLTLPLIKKVPYAAHEQDAAPPAPETQGPQKDDPEGGD
jgi:signal transduction histidine kinase